MFFIRKFPGWNVGDWVITITYYTHFSIRSLRLKGIKFSQIKARVSNNAGSKNKYLHAGTN